MQNKNRILIRTAIAALLMGAAFVAALPAVVPAPACAAESGMSVNINSATADELMTLPGIGQAKASAILAFRTENGPFGAPEELLQV